MKNILVLLIIILSLWSCSKRDVQVPKVGMQGEEKVQNNSAIWMFYNEDGTVDVNEKNRISSTHWFFNIDKKLSLKTILPEVNRLLIRHNEKSPHNTKKMNNYFTYVNSINNQLSFYRIDSINFKLIAKKDLPKISGDTILVNVNSSTLKIPVTEKKAIIQAVFDSDINFQTYLEAKALFSKTLKNNQLSKVEYFINK